MSDVEKLVIFLDNIHAESMNVKSLCELGYTINIQKKLASSEFRQAGHFDFLDKDNFPIIYINDYIIKYCPLCIIQYTIAHELSHLIQYVYYKDLIMKEYNEWQWHGPSFKRILHIFGYREVDFALDQITIPDELSELIHQGVNEDKLLTRYSLEEWKLKGGTIPPIIFSNDVKSNTS